MTQLSPVDYVAPVVVTLATVYKLSALARVTSTPVTRALTGTLLWLTLATLCFFPPVYTTLGTATGVANVGILLAQTCGVVLIWPVRTPLVYQTHPPAAARRIVRHRYRWLPPVLALQLGLWWTAHGGADDPRFVFDRASDPHAVAFTAVHHAVLLVGAFDAIITGWHAGSRVTGPVRLGMRTITVAGLGAVAMVLYDASVWAGALAHAHSLLWAHAELVMAIQLTVATAGLAVGATLPAWGPRLLDYWRARRALHALRPLWHDVAQALPEVVLPMPKLLGGPRRRLHRCVIELRDAELAVRGYRPTEDQLETVARRLGVQPVDALLREALTLARGVEARRLGVSAAGEGVEPDDPHGGASLGEEVAHLCEVARRYKQARTVLSAGVSG